MFDLTGALHGKLLGVLSNLRQGRGLELRTIKNLFYDEKHSFDFAVSALVAIAFVDRGVRHDLDGRRREFSDTAEGW
jgi:hypothetical protein